MRAFVSRSWPALAALFINACALAGYDFGDYRGATVNGEASAGAEHDGDTGASGGESELGTAGRDSGSGNGGGSAEPAGPLVTASTFGVGGETAGGDNTGGSTDAGGASGSGACEPRGCFEQGLVCGPADDGCGRPLDCGGCFWWFQECRQNRCEIPE